MNPLFAQPKRAGLKHWRQPAASCVPTPARAHHGTGGDESTDISQPPNLPGFLQKPGRSIPPSLAVEPVFSASLHHRLEVFRLYVIEESPIAQYETTALPGSVYELLDVLLHLLGCADAQ